MTEGELIHLGKQADREAIAELFRRHYPYSVRLASGILRHTEDAQDAVQVAYFTAFRNLPDFRGDSSFKTWISRIVVNCCLLHLRRARQRARWVQLEDRGSVRSLTSHAPSPENFTWTREISTAFSSAVQRLPKHLRETYTLFAVTGMSLQEVAAEMGLTISATKTRLFRARAGLRSSLAPVWNRGGLREEAG